MAAKVITGIFVDNAKAPPPDGTVDMISRDYDV